MRESWTLRTVCALSIALGGCNRSAPPAPRIEFTKLPPSGEGSPNKLEVIEGKVTGAEPGLKVVVFARSGIWWVQPAVDKPFTTVQADSRWSSVTHPGSAYGAILVTPSYVPPATANALPSPGGAVLAVATAEGEGLARETTRSISFSGYDWAIRQSPSDRGGARNLYDPENAWTDKNGFLHLRIKRQGSEWSSAEVSLSRSLGYGSYRFVVRDISKLEPGAVFSVFTWDDSGPPREIDIEVSRWGESGSKNAQYVIQPYYVPANVVRFMAPGGLLSYSFRWEQGKVTFKTVRGSSAESVSGVVSEYAFTSGIPTPGNELIHMNLYVYDNKTRPLQADSEVIVERFEYLP